MWGKATLQVLVCQTPPVEEPTDPALDRFISTVRRAWWFVVVCMLVGGVLFGVRAGRAHFQSTGSVRYLDDSGALEAAKLPSDLVSRTISLELDVEALSLTSVDSAIAQEIGQSVHVTTAIDTTGKVLTVTVSSATAEGADSGLTKFVEKVRARRSQQAQLAASTVVSSLNAQRAADQKRIAELDDLIRPLGPQEVSLSDAYRVERTKRSDEFTTIDIQLSALQIYQEGADEAVRFVPGNAAEKLGGVRGGVMLGLVLGLVIGIGCLSVRSYFDRRVRSGSDLATSGLRLLAVAGAGGDPLAATSLASCLSAEADASGSSDFLLACQSGANVDSLIALVKDDLSQLAPEVSISVAVDLSDSGGGLLLTRTVPQVIFVVPWGQVTSDELSASAKRYALAGARMIGCVLTDVPARFKKAAFN